MAKWMSGSAMAGAILGLAGTAFAQAPVQFQSNLRVRDLDGKTGTAKLFVGATKLRMEFPVSGETRPTIIEPVRQTQFTISPKQKNYMEMPLGESGGTVRIPRLSTLNPTNPCSNDQLSECKRLGAETVNGYATEKWEYKNVDGDLETAWIATKLRFPIRTTASSGATTEITNVVEGPQAASLFEIPAGFAKVDDVGDSDLPNIDPAMMQKAMEMAQAMMKNPAIANAIAAENAGRGANSTRSSGSSIWESGPGWILNVTVTAKGGGDRTRADVAWKEHTTSSGRYTASIPLNAAAGPIPGKGPQVYLLASAGSGSPQAEAAPFTLAVDARADTLEQVRSGCGNGTGDFGNIDRTRAVTQKGQFSTTIANPATHITGGAIMQLNAAQTAYSLTVQVGALSGAEGDEVTTSKSIDHCAGERPENKTETKKIEIPGVAFTAKDVPLPPNTAAGIKGMVTIPWNLLPGTTTATLEWNITRVGAK